MLKNLAQLFYIEFILLFRRSQEWLYPVSFFLIVVCLFPIIFSPTPAFLQHYFGSCVWIAALFASLLSIENIYFADLEDGHLTQLLFSNIPLAYIIFCKLLTKWLAAMLPLILITPIIATLFNLSTHEIAIACLSLSCGTPIIIAVGMFTVTLTLGLRQHGVLLSLLLLPLVIPVIIFGVGIIHNDQAGLAIAGPLALLAGLMLLTLITFPFLITLTLKISLENIN